MNTSIIYNRFIAFLLLPALAVMVGCQSGGTSTYIDPQGTQTIVSLDQINIQDWNMAADDLVADLLASGVLDRVPEQPAVMAVSRIVNNTLQQVDTDSLTKKIRIALNQSGKVVTTSTLGLRGQVEDPLAAEVNQMNAFLEGRPQQTTMPYFTLSGKLLQDNARAGTVRQVTYTFQLSLTTVRDGLAVWEGEKLITKQATGARVGW